MKFHQHSITLHRSATSSWRASHTPQISWSSSSSAIKPKSFYLIFIINNSSLFPSWMNNSNVNENISLAQFDLRVLPNQGYGTDYYELSYPGLIFTLVLRRKLRYCTVRGIRSRTWVVLTVILTVRDQMPCPVVPEFKHTSRAGTWDCAKKNTFPLPIFIVTQGQIVCRNNISENFFSTVLLQS